MTQEPSVQDTQELAGWKLVPVEPTGAMQNAGWREVDKQGFQTEDTEVAPIWRAMLAAAPPPATSSAMEALRVTDAMVDAAMAVAPIPHRGPNVFDPERMRTALEAALQAGTGVAVKADDIRELLRMIDNVQSKPSHESIYGIYNPQSRMGLLVEKIRASLAAPVQQAGVESELVERLQQLLDEATWDSIEHDGDDDRKEADSVLAMIAASLSQLQQRIAEAEAIIGDRNDELSLIDWIADKIGLRHDEELSRENFGNWLAALAASDAKLAEKDREIERLLNANIGSSM